MAAFRSAAFRHGFIIQPGPGSIRSCSASFWPRLKNFDRSGGNGSINCAPWLWLPALAIIAYALYLGETRNLTVAACVWQFPFIAVGMAALLVCAVSPRLPLCRVAIPGAAFIASIAYSAYLIQKLVINGVEQFCSLTISSATSAFSAYRRRTLRLRRRRDSVSNSRTFIPTIASPNCSTEFTRRGGQTTRCPALASSSPVA